MYDSLVDGDIRGSYRVLRTLGRGGMGTTYEAERTTDGLRVALKELHLSRVARSFYAKAESLDPNDALAKKALAALCDGLADDALEGVQSRINELHSRSTNPAGKGFVLVARGPSLAREA